MFEDEATLSIGASFSFKSWVDYVGTALITLGGWVSMWYFENLTISGMVLVTFFALVIATAAEIEVSWETVEEFE